MLRDDHSSNCSDISIPPYLQNRQAYLWCLFDMHSKEVSRDAIFCETMKRGKIALPLFTLIQSQGLDSHDLLGLCLNGLVHFFDHLVGDFLDFLFTLL